MSAFDPTQITRGYVDSLLAPYVADLSQFDSMDPPNSVEYGYEVKLYKNAGTVCEDLIILRLNSSGEMDSFNVVRTGIEDPSEVDVEYFEEQLFALLETIEDTMVSYEVGYLKIDGIICANYYVELADDGGGRYVNVYMFT